MNQVTIQSRISGVMARALATGLFVSRCTITALPSPLTVGPSGSPNGAYVAESGLTDIRCMKSAVNPFRSPNVDETKRTSEQQTIADEHVLLEAYYPTITTAKRAVIDGVTHDIVTVENDSQFQMTRLRVRVASI